MHIHVKDEVSMPTHVDRREEHMKENYQNGSHLKLKVRITKYLMCIYGGHMCICIPNMKLLCLTMCQREVCTDDDNANDANDGQSMIVQGSLVDKPNEPKTTTTPNSIVSGRLRNILNATPRQQLGISQRSQCQMY